ncbi:MAG: type II and III secretion system protein family protein, partial [Planctomycetaceae bacterium]|nr:type II and III secretion system protein family protein [Planctomycetaceae bacterium]
MLNTRLKGGRCWLACALLMGLLPAAARAQQDDDPDPMIPSADPQAVIHDIKHAHDRVEMVVNSSRILRLDQKIPKAVVNNPDLLDVTPLSPTEIQIFAKKAGVTQVNVWGEDQKIRSLDVIVFADAQELAMLLKHQFPNATLRVIPLANSVVISGYLDDPDQVSRIIQMAEDFHPKVINNIRIGGVQQVLLHVKVLEVSRTRLRQVGFDFSRFNSGDFAVSGISGLVRSGSTQTSAIDAITSNGATVTGAGVQTVTFGVMDGASSFFGFLDFLRQYDLMKIMAEPNLVCVSGRPAFFNSGGEFPIIVPQSLGTVSIQYKKYGTQLDFVPIVLGNGNIRLEVKPRVSEIDNTRAVIINNNTVPALKTREAETGVEMQAGQTLAIAGLVYNRQESTNRGIPWISDVPYLGAAFSRKRQEEQEVELLILVTPSLVEPMDCDEVPPGGPGLHSATPNDLQLYLKGHLEVGTDAPLAPAAGAGQYPPHCP